MLPAYYIERELNRLRETLEREQLQREQEIRVPLSAWDDVDEDDDATR